MMRRSLFLSLIAAGTGTPAAAQMQMQMAPATPKPAPLPGHPSAEEKKFVDEASRYVTKTYAKPDDAKKAGYVEFTPEDSTGAISWANRRWTSSDFEHPSQVWYDASGRVIGADYSVLQENSPQAPHLWGVDPRRWIKIGSHIHYGIKQPDGSIKLGGLGRQRYAAAGGSLSAPTKQVLVAMGLAKSPDDVAFLFLFPPIWDLQLWVIPNPDGAFAEKNPDVKPKNAQAHPS